jgi:capsular exopolysaccharide synthesis family protein
MPNQDTNPPPALSQGTNLVDRINVALHVQRYMKLLARRWLILFICGLGGLGYSTYNALKTPDVYRAFSVLGFKTKVQTESSARANVIEVLDKYYETQIQLMMSTRVLSRVENALRDGKARSVSQSRPTSPPRAALGQGSTFQLTVESTDLEYVKRFAKTWANEFMAYKREERSNALGESAAATQEEKVRYERRWREAVAATQAFLNEHNISSAKETGDAAQQRLDKALDEYNSILLLRQRLEQQRPEDIAKGAESGTGVPRANDGDGKTSDASKQGPSGMAAIYLSESQQYRDLSYRLFSKESEYKRFLETLREKHPFMVGLKKEVDQLKADLEFQIKLIAEKQEVTIRKLKFEEQGYLKNIEDLRSKVRESSEIQFRHQQLTEEQSSLKQQVDRMSQTLLSLDTMQNDPGQFEVYEECIWSDIPVAPRRSKMILTGLVAGLGLGLALIYLLHRLDDRLELAQDIEEELQEPVLGQIPLVDKDALKDGHLVLTRMSQHNMFAESIRGVRSAVLLGAQEGTKQVLLVSSAVPGDGKTTFTINFAATLAIAGNRVLLVDADLRRGNIHNYFSQQRSPGLAEILAGTIPWREAVASTDVESLKLVSSGDLPPNPGELLVGPVTRRFVQEVREEFDYIVFDCPPLTAIDDTYSLVSLADGLLFVVRAGQTSMRFAKTALAAVHQRGARILGIVLNGITADNPYYYYNYYYHAYYNKGQAQTGEKKAEPKLRSMKPVSIAAEAKALAGEVASSRTIAAETEAKAELFKARRAAQRAVTDESGGEAESVAGGQAQDSSSGHAVRPAQNPPVTTDPA